MSRKQVEKKYEKLQDAWEEMKRSIDDFVWAKGELCEATCDSTLFELLNRMEDSINAMGLWDIASESSYPEDCSLLLEWNDLKSYMRDDYDGSAEDDYDEEDEDEE